MHPRWTGLTRRSGTRQTSASRFSGSVAIVTGGASGIGRAIGEQLVAAGAHVVLADIDGKRADHAVEALTRRNTAAFGSISAAALDVCDAAAVLRLVDDVVDQHGRLDMMFNNAGIVLGGNTHEMTRQQWDRIIDVNLNGVVNGVLAAYPVMVAQRHGHIVNTASMAGLAPSVMVAPYSATKHAVVGLSTALRPEAARFGVDVTVLCPGAVDTPILDSPGPDDSTPETSPRQPPTLTLTGRQYMAVIGLTPIPAERFARTALRGIARRRSVVVAPRSAQAIWYLQRITPGLVDRVGRRTAGKIATELDRLRTTPA
jgi:NAD(P)-dependent dehydrogenase (short-subunit alcohol dehydrogenase family)